MRDKSYMYREYSVDELRGSLSRNKAEINNFLSRQSKLLSTIVGTSTLCAVLVPETLPFCTVPIAFSLLQSLKLLSLHFRNRNTKVFSERPDGFLGYSIQQFLLDQHKEITLKTDWESVDMGYYVLSNPIKTFDAPNLTEIRDKVKALLSQIHFFELLDEEKYPIKVRGHKGDVHVRYQPEVKFDIESHDSGYLVTSFHNAGASGPSSTYFLNERSGEELLIRFLI